MYTRDDITQDILALFGKTPGNTVDIPGIGETVLFDEPLIGFATTDDEIFDDFKRKEVIGENYFTPSQWLPGARTVISLFLPFTEAVRVSNRADREDPSIEWLYARIEGQEFISRYMADVRMFLEGKGIAACVPALDERFGVKIEMTGEGPEQDFHADSRWSERHAAYACGLGTFGLSRGLITKKGMAGRFASVIISAEYAPTQRDYTGVYDYCIRCGACVRNCPANAISLEYGKNNVQCNRQVETMKEKYSPRYGCGKCQVRVPCEFRSPLVRK